MSKPNVLTELSKGLFGCGCLLMMLGVCIPAVVLIFAAVAGSALP